MNEQPSAFIDIVLDQILFFATCTDDQCDADVAVENLEAIGGSLVHEATRADREQLLARAADRVAIERSDRARSVLKDLRGVLGFEDPQA